MADIYGELIEFPDGKLAAEIKRHDFVPGYGRTKEDKAVNSRFCTRCGYARVCIVHPEEKPQEST